MFAFSRSNKPDHRPYLSSCLAQYNMHVRLHAHTVTLITREYLFPLATVVHATHSHPPVERAWCSHGVPALRQEGRHDWEHLERKQGQPAMVPCCHATMLPCCHAAMLPCCHAALLCCICPTSYVSSYYCTQLQTQLC